MVEVLIAILIGVWIWRIVTIAADKCPLHCDICDRQIYKEAPKKIDADTQPAVTASCGPTKVTICVTCADKMITRKVALIRKGVAHDVALAMALNELVEHKLK